MLEILNKNRNIVIVASVIIVIAVIVWYSGVFSSKKEVKSEGVEEVNQVSKDVNMVGKPLNTSGDSKIKVYNFNTSWCRYSVMFAPEWAKFESMVEENENIEALDVKCDDESNEGLCASFDVPGFPSVVVVKGDEKRDYSGARSAEAILKFVESL